MAVEDDHGSGGSMDLADHLKTWQQFTGLIKGSIVGIGVIMLILFVFRTHN
jgi:hypothetical protein